MNNRLKEIFRGKVVNKEHTINNCPTVPDAACRRHVGNN